MMRRWLALSRAERRLIVRAFWALAAVDLGLRVQGFRRVLERIQRQTTAPLDSVGAEHFRRVGEYVRWLEVASRYHPVRAQCLHRSLALHWWLRQDGLPSELRIGVRKDRGELKAHAWVELGGHVVNDQPAAVGPFTLLQHIDGRPLSWVHTNALRTSQSPSIIQLGR